MGGFPSSLDFLANDKNSLLSAHGSYTEAPPLLQSSRTPPNPSTATVQFICCIFIINMRFGFGILHLYILEESMLREKSSGLLWHGELGMRASNFACLVTSDLENLSFAFTLG